MTESYLVCFMLGVNMGSLILAVYFARQAIGSDIGAANVQKFPFKTRERAWEGV